MRGVRPMTYRLCTRWQFDAPQHAVWDAIVHAPTWPQWWGGVEQVDTLVLGDADGLGAQHWVRCKSVLPFRLCFTSLVTRIEPLCLIEGQVEGDLEGIGCCRLRRAAGRTAVQYDWQVRTTAAWMNWLGPLARPLFCWNHDAIMRQGGIGLARWLARGHAPETAGAVTPLKPPSG